MPSAIGATLIRVHQVTVAWPRLEVELPVESGLQADQLAVALGPEVESESPMVAVCESTRAFWTPGA